jgi:UDP-N-acetylglucosamine 2-epimerase (non-hydrolysing)
MDTVFFNELNLPHPLHNLGISNEKLHGTMTGKMIIGIEDILLKEQPDWVLVQGDTNTALSGALAASKLGIKVGHVEAGLRSYDRTMPEELNRVVIDHLAEALFCPTPETRDITLGEGISSDKVFLTGNTIVDAVAQNLALAKQSNLPNTYSEKEYLLLTMHRPENVDKQDHLMEIIHSLEKLSQDLDTPILFPIHPRTAAALKTFHIPFDTTKIKEIEPIGYLKMLLLMEQAKLIITDSGGVQEEACILQVPAITIRQNTERPETVKVGANLVVGRSEEKITAGAKTMLNKPRSWVNPFGDGNSAKAICDVLLKV